MFAALKKREINFYSKNLTWLSSRRTYWCTPCNGYNVFEKNSKDVYCLIYFVPLSYQTAYKIFYKKKLKLFLFYRTTRRKTVQMRFVRLVICEVK